MANVSSFLRKTPLCALETYFAYRQIALPAPITWDDTDPKNREDFVAAVSQLSDRDRGQVEADVGLISALATEAGQFALLSLGVDLNAAPQPVSPHERALSIFLTDADLFRHAHEILYSDGRRRRPKLWDGFCIAKGLIVHQDPQSVALFEGAIAEEFNSTNVQVDIYHRSRSSLQGDVYQLVQVTVYHEDMARDSLEFSGKRLVRAVRHPVTEAVLTYEPATGMLEVIAKTKRKRQHLAFYAARELLKISLTDKKIPSRTFKLDILQKLHKFEFEAKDGIESVELTYLRLMPEDEQGERVTLERAIGHERTIWDIAADRFREQNPLNGGWIVTQAKLWIKFHRASGASAARSMTVELTNEGGCSLREGSQHEQLIGEKYLSLWGILTYDPLRAPD